MKIIKVMIMLNHVFLKQILLTVFIREKFFSTLSTNPGFNETSSGGLASVVAADKGEDFYQNLSRNIIFSMMDSLSTFTDVRLPSLENDLFDLAINMPAKYKMNGNIYIEVLNKLCPNLMEFDYANTNIKAKHSLKKQNLIKISNYFLNKIFNFKME